MRDDGLPDLFENGKQYCVKHGIEISDIGEKYVFGRGTSRQPNVTIEHHYRVDIFLVVIDFPLHRLNLRFNERTVELLNLSTTLAPSNNYKKFNSDNIYRLVKSFYSYDCVDQECFHMIIYCF